MRILHKVRALFCCTPVGCQRSKENTWLQFLSALWLFSVELGLSLLVTEEVEEEEVEQVEQGQGVVVVGVEVEVMILVTLVKPSLGSLARTIPSMRKCLTLDSPAMARLKVESMRTQEQSVR